MIINIGENMENNKLIVLNQNSELALLKSRNLLDITKKIDFLCDGLYYRSEWIIKSVYFL